MIRITVLADNDIEDVSAMDIEYALRDIGILTRRTNVRRQTDKQYRKALAVFGVAAMLLVGCAKHDRPTPVTNTPSPVTTTPTVTFPPTTDQPSDSPVITSPPPPFENPPNSTGPGKG
jgi:hypothetical protein